MAELPEFVEEKWLRFGIWIGIANLLFIVLIVVLLQYDPLWGLAAAIVLSILAGIAVTVWATRQ